MPVPAPALPAGPAGWPHRLRFLALNLSAWVLFSAVVSVWLVAQRRGLGVPSDGWEIFRHTLIFWGLWSIPTAFIFKTFRRHPWEPDRWRRTLSFHVVASLVWMLLYGALLIPVAVVAFGIPWRRLPEFAPMFYGTMFWVEYLLYWPVFAVAAANDGLRRARDREALARELAQARLDALRSRIQPHFLFNTLAAISGLLRSGEIDRSARSIELLADLLRRVVSQSDQPLVRLDEELAAADLYLEIQKTRCGPRLDVDVRAEPQAMAFGVPSLLLQPLLENAFEHGVSKVPGPVRVALVARKVSDRLEIEITNPIAEGGARGHGAQGLGLANTRSRIELLFPEEGRCDLVLDPEARVARTVVTLPARPVE
jgi:two-component system, LytTR family, sensor kinase